MDYLQEKIVLAALKAEVRCLGRNHDPGNSSTLDRLKAELTRLHNVGRLTLSLVHTAVAMSHKSNRCRKGNDSLLDFSGDFYGLYVRRRKHSSHGGFTVTCISN